MNDLGTFSFGRDGHLFKCTAQGNSKATACKDHAGGNSTIDLNLNDFSTWESFFGMKRMEFH